MNEAEIMNKEEDSEVDPTITAPTYQTNIIYKCTC